MPETDKRSLSRMVITCGGTGGHFYPGLSIAVTAQQRGIEVLLLLSGVNSAAQSAIAGKAGVNAVVLPQMPHPGTPVRAWRFLRGAAGGLRKSLRYLRSFAPQAVLGMGSFAMTPVIVAARMRGIPVFLHDGNTVVGKANRFFSRIARAVGCAYPPVNRTGIHAPWEVVGMPVRPELRKRSGITKAEAVDALNEHFSAEFSADIATVLVIGGSQGAASFNTILPEAFRNFSKPLQVMHLSGRGKLDDTAREYQGFDGKLLLLESSEHIEWFLGAADLIFARAGGSTLAELMLFGKPAILIPYPYAAEDHQRRNAEWFSGIGGGKMIVNSELSRDFALEMLRIPAEQWRQCAAASLAAARPDAAEKMLELIEKHIQ